MYMSTLIFWNVSPLDRPPTAGIRGGSGSAQSESLDDGEGEDDGEQKFRIPTLFTEDMDEELQELARQANSKTSFFFRIIQASWIGKLNSIHDVSLALTNWH